MKKIAIDAYYLNGICYVVGGIFNKWKDEHVSKFIYADVKVESEYIPGEFYKRELPGIMKLLEQIDLKEFDNIILDGYVYLEEGGYYDKETRKYIPVTIKKGLGEHLKAAIYKTYPHTLYGMPNIVGVAKNLYGNNEKAYGCCYRGESKKPLYITSLNRHNDLIFPKSIQKMVKQMSGEYRMPTILKEVDLETRKIAVELEKKKNMFKKDYRVVVEWAQDGTPYYQYFRKGEPIIPTDEEKRELQFSSEKK